MKLNLRYLLALALASSVSAAPLASTTAVHAHPDASAATIGVLSAGTEPVLATSSETVPAGWEAVELTGTHEVYVHSKDIAKSLDVKPGAAFHTGPKLDSPVFATMAPGDTTEITGIRGKWTQVKLQKKVVGFIHTGDTPPPAPLSVANAPAAQTSSAPAAAPAPAPAAPSAATFAGPGRAAQTMNLGDGGSSALPRLFQGGFASTRRPLMPRRPYDYQLTDANGERYAYLDLSKLLLTEQTESYVGHTVVVYGTAKPVPNTRDIVIEVESLQLR